MSTTKKNVSKEKVIHSDVVDEQKHSEEEIHTNDGMSDSVKLITILIGLVIIVFVGLWLLSMSNIGMGDRPSENTLFEYNGFEFVRDSQGFWIVEAFNTRGNLFRLSSYYAPLQLQDIPIDVRARYLIAGKPFAYLSLDSNLDAIGAGAAGGIAAIEVGKVVGQRYGVLNIPTQTGVTNPSEFDDVLQVSCDNVSQTHSVTFFTISDQTAITIDNGCVVVSGTNTTELIRASNRLMFSIVNIMDQDG